VGHGLKFITVISRALICALVFFSGGLAADVRIEVDSVDSSPNGFAELYIYIENSIPIASVIVPLRYNPAVLFPDSISFAPTCASPDHLTTYTHSTDSSIIRLLVLPNITDPMPVIFDPGGLLATVWFSVSPLAESGYSVIDTAYTHDSIVYRDEVYHFYPEELQASDVEGRHISPESSPGGVSIR